MSSLSSILRITCPKSSSCRAVIRRALTRRRVVVRERRVSTAAIAAMTATKEDNVVNATVSWTLLAATLLASGIAVMHNNNTSTSTSTNTSTTILTTTTTTTTTTQAEPRRVNSLHQHATTTTSSTTTFRGSNLNRFRSITDRGMNSKYIVDWKVVLGEGAYGSVHPARLAATGEKVALKRISRRFTNSQGFKAETQALLRIFDNGGHPNISGLRDMYEDHNNYYLILDLVSGGEMFDHLINYGAYSEADAARLMYEIASALAFMHGVGVVHADLKPENLLLSTKNRWDGTIKVIDFGCAVVQDMEDASHDEAVDFKPSTRRANSNGTTAYWSPDRFDDSAVISPAMDMWSVGVILYIMLTGVHPFDIRGVSADDEIEKSILENPRPPLDQELVGHLSESAIDLIKKLMAKDPAKRLTAYEMLHHPWVRGETATREKMKDSDTKLSKYKDLRYKLQAGLFAVLVRQGHSDARLNEARINPRMSRRDDRKVHILKRAFDVFDAEGKGYVTSDDLGRVTKEHTGSDVSSRDTMEFLASHNGDEQSTAANLSLSQFNTLFSGLKQRHFPRGHYIFRAGEPGEAMYFLSSGKVEVQTRKGQLVAILRSGDFFGEGSLLEKDKPRFTSARCATPVDVIEIPREDFDRYVGGSDQTRMDLNMKWRARQLTYAKNLLRLQKNVMVRTFKKGEVIYREGDVGTSMFRLDDADSGELLVSHGETVVHKYVSGDSFGESSLLFRRPRSSTVTCNSETCRLYEMKGEDFLAVVESSPQMLKSLKNMARKRLFKRAVKSYSLDQKRGLTNEDIECVFHELDVDKNGSLDLEDVTRLMHRMDPNFPVEEIQELLEFVDVKEDGQISIEEFKNLFRQFEQEKEGS